MQGTWTGTRRPQVTPPHYIHGEKQSEAGGRSPVADKRHHVNVRIDRRLPSTDALADHRLD
jgi:hypothetical protein